MYLLAIEVDAKKENKQLGRCHTGHFIAQLCRATLSRDKVAACNSACCKLRQIP